MKVNCHRRLRGGGCPVGGVDAAVDEEGLVVAGAVVPVDSENLEAEPVSVVKTVDLDDEKGPCGRNGPCRCCGPR